MSYYGGTITVKGRNLITSLMAGETIEFTRVVVGSGEMPEGIEPLDMADLVEPVADATSSVPVVKNNVLSMVVEYRNEMNGGLKEGFWLKEFGIYAKTETTEEVLLYYATLGDSPQPVNAYKDNRIDIRRYPVTIAIEVDADVQVSYSPGAFVTSEEAYQTILTLVGEAMNEVSFASEMEITIPTSGWKADKDTNGAYELHSDVLDERIKESLIPALTILPESHSTVKDCEMSAVCRTLEGALRVYAKRIPKADVSANLLLISAVSMQEEKEV